MPRSNRGTRIEIPYNILCEHTCLFIEMKLVDSVSRDSVRYKSVSVRGIGLDAVRVNIGFDRLNRIALDGFIIANRVNGNFASTVIGGEQETPGFVRCDITRIRI